MHSYMAAELGEQFDLTKAIRIGMLPLVWSSEDPDKTLAAYSGLYLREEVQQEGLVRNVGGFARFLEAMSFSHAAVLNLSNVARISCQPVPKPAKTPLYGERPSWRRKQRGPCPVRLVNQLEKWEGARKPRS